MSNTGERFILARLMVSEPEPIDGQPGLYVTELTLPNCVGSIKLAHIMSDSYLKGIEVDPNTIDPLSTLFQELRAFVNKE